MCVSGCKLSLREHRWVFVIPVLHCLPEFAQTHVRWVSDAIQPSHPLSPPSPLALNFPQYQGLFQWVDSSHQVAKVLEFSFSISSSNVYSGLISFRIDWFDLLAVQGILESSSMLSLLYGLTLTSVHDYQQDHHFDYTDLCQQSNVSAF